MIECREKLFRIKNIECLHVPLQKTSLWESFENKHQHEDGQHENFSVYKLGLSLVFSTQFSKNVLEETTSKIQNSSSNLHENF